MRFERCITTGDSVILLWTVHFIYRSTEHKQGEDHSQSKWSANFLEPSSSSAPSDPHALTELVCLVRSLDDLLPRLFKVGGQDDISARRGESRR